MALTPRGFLSFFLSFFLLSFFLSFFLPFFFRFFLLSFFSPFKMNKFFLPFFFGFFLLSFFSPFKMNKAKRYQALNFNFKNSIPPKLEITFNFKWEFPLKLNRIKKKSSLKNWYRVQFNIWNPFTNKIGVKVYIAFNFI